MSTQQHENMNPVRLFSLLTDQRWELDASPVEFHDAAYEYLLRFCEVNRNALIDRIDKERSKQPTRVLIRRMAMLLLRKWDLDRDYRFLNLLYKFKAKRYLDHFPKDSSSRNLQTRLDQTLSRELNHD